jgi:hypothetical protein
VTASFQDRPDTTDYSVGAAGTLGLVLPLHERKRGKKAHAIFPFYFFVLFEPFCR